MHKKLRSKMENKEKELMEVREQIIDAMGKVCKIWGLNEVTGRLYGVLFLSDRPLTLDEMASQLGMSKPSMSLHVRHLEKVGMVNNVWMKGSRKNYYAAETNMEKIIHGFMEREKIALDVMLSTIENSKVNFNKLKEEPDPESLCSGSSGLGWMTYKTRTTCGTKNGARTMVPALT